MAQVNLSGTENTTIASEVESQTVNVQPISVDISTGDSMSSETKVIEGLSSAELQDPNKIIVTVADKDAPIVILFGPPSCGKTMTLVRLTRYLRAHEYQVSPVRTFRPTYDANYQNVCDNFNIMMNSDDAAKSTSKISFMLVKVIKNSRTICQLLEAPGEYYFDPKNPNAPFPTYINAIQASKNRKIWAVMVEPDWENQSDRDNYVDRIKMVKKGMTARDNAVFVYNKIDKTPFLIDAASNAHMAEAKKDIRDNFPGIFEPFRNQTPILNWFTPYNMDFAIFQTGYYNPAADGTFVFTQGPDVFPARLWNVIRKRING